MLSETKKRKGSDPQKIPTSQNLSQVAIANSNRFLVLATEPKESPGGVRVTTYPLSNSVVEIQAHSKGIRKMKLSYDDGYLVTVGHDGMICVYEFRKDPTINLHTMPYAEELLMSREKYFRKKKKIDEISSKTKEITAINERQRLKTDKAKQEQISELEIQIAKQKHSEETRFNELLEAKRRMEEQFQLEEQTLTEQHQAHKRALEAEFREKKKREQESCENITKVIEKATENFLTFKENFNKVHKEILEKKKESYDKILEQVKNEREALFKQMEAEKDKFEELRDEKENEAEREIERLKEENESEIKKIREEMSKAEFAKKSNQTVLNLQAQRIDEQKIKNREIEDEIQAFLESNNNLKKEKEAQIKELEERDKTIEDKEKRIADLKKKTQELEKFKFVLDYKIKELKRDIGPREEEIAKMKEQISNMRSEVLHFKRTNNNLKLIVADLNLRHRGMQREIDELDEQYRKNQNYILSYEGDINDCLQKLDDYKELKKKVLTNLYEKYVQNEKKRLETNVDIQKEFINQRSYLETTVKGLKDKFKKNLDIHLQDNMRIMKENVELISVINELKRDLKDNKEAKILEKKKEKEKALGDLGELDAIIQDNARRIEELRRQIELDMGEEDRGVRLPAINK